MTTTDLAYAQWTERGVRAVCPTTGEPYISSMPRSETFNGRRGVWLRCRHCDAHGRTRIDPAFNPSEPQAHPYLLDEVRYGDA
jgi:hypothetical protein